MTNKQLTPIGQICTAIDKMSGSLSEQLKGTGINPERFLATAKMAVQTHSDKDRLARADRNSLYLAIKKSAGDGLMPDNREAALVVYGEQVQYQPMVQGLVKLARNSGDIVSINAEVVYENDEFELFYDFDGLKFKHAPNWKEERGEPCLVWASVKLISGEVIARAYPKKRILEISTRSKMSGNYDPKKGKDWEEFWRKAAIRNILKYAPRSTALDKALDVSDSEFKAENEDFIEAETPVAQEKETKASKIIKEAEPISEPEILEAEIVEDSEEEIPI